MTILKAGSSGARVAYGPAGDGAARSAWPQDCLRILWELSRADHALTFRALQSAAETNPALLNTRLKELRIGGLVFRDADGYRLARGALSS